MEAIGNRTPRALLLAYGGWKETAERRGARLRSYGRRDPAGTEANVNWTRFRNRLLGRPASLERDLDEELDFHGEMKEHELRAAGVSSREAQDTVRRSMGNLTLAREQAREAWTFVWFGD